MFEKKNVAETPFNLQFNVMVQNSFHQNSKRSFQLSSFYLLFCSFPIQNNDKWGK